MPGRGEEARVEAWVAVSAGEKVFVVSGSSSNGSSVGALASRLLRR